MSIPSLRSIAIFTLALGLLALPAAAEDSAIAQVAQICAEVDVDAHVESWDAPADNPEGHWQVSGSIGDVPLDDGQWRALRRLEGDVLVEEILHGDSVVYRSLAGTGESGVHVIWTDVANDECQVVEGAQLSSTVDLAYVPTTECKDAGKKCDPEKDCCPGHTPCPPTDKCPGGSS